MADDISSPTLIKASRVEDSTCLPDHVEQKIRQRINMTWGGAIVALAGSAIAIIAAMREPVDLKLVIIGIVGALVGAGSVDANLIFNFLRGNK